MKKLLPLLNIYVSFITWQLASMKWNIILKNIIFECNHVSATVSLVMYYLHRQITFILTTHWPFYCNIAKKKLIKLKISKLNLLGTFEHWNKNKENKTTTYKRFSYLFTLSYKTDEIIQPYKLNFISRIKNFILFSEYAQCTQDTYNIHILCFICSLHLVLLHSKCQYYTITLYLMYCH